MPPCLFLQKEFQKGHQISIVTKRIGIIQSVEMNCLGSFEVMRKQVGLARLVAGLNNVCPSFVLSFSFVLMCIALTQSQESFQINFDAISFVQQIGK
jgi:hypothetical protein